MDCVDSKLDWIVGRGFKFGGNIGSLVRYNKNTKKITINITGDCSVEGWTVRFYAYQNAGDTPIMFEKTIVNGSVDFLLEGNLTDKYGDWTLETVLISDDKKYADVGKITYTIVRTADGDGIPPIPPTETSTGVDELIKKLDTKMADAKTAQDSLESKITEADGQVIKIDNAVTGIDTTVDKINTAIQSGDSKEQELKTAIADVDTEIAKINTAVSGAETTVDNKIKELNDAVAEAKISGGGGGAGGEVGWYGTQAEYSNIKLKIPDKTYNIVDEADDSVSPKYRIGKNPLDYYDSSLLLLAQSREGNFEMFNRDLNDRFNNKLDTRDRFKNLDDFLIESNELYNWYIDTDDRNPETASGGYSNLNTLCYKDLDAIYLADSVDEYSDENDVWYATDSGVTCIDCGEYYLIRGTVASDTDICKFSSINITENTQYAMSVFVENTGGTDLKLGMDYNVNTTNFPTTADKQLVLFETFGNGYQTFKILSKIGDTVNFKIYKGISVHKGSGYRPYVNNKYVNSKVRFYLNENLNTKSIILRGCYKMNYQSSSWRVLEGQTYNDNIELAKTDWKIGKRYDFVITPTFLKAFDEDGNEYSLTRNGAFNTRTLSPISTFGSQRSTYMSQMLVYDGDLGETKARAEVAKNYLMSGKFNNR